ncbi:MAG TPA: type VI secretion system baseplate subunit TssG, partial [Acidiphilium sp.]
MTKGVIARLTRTPARFRFGAAVRLLWIASGRRDPGEAIGFSAPVSLAHPTAEVEAAEPGCLSTRLIGLIGASSPMPRWYTELVAQA